MVLTLLAVSSPVLGAESESLAVKGIAAVEAEARVFAARHEVTTLVSRIPGSAAGRERETWIAAVQAWRDEFAARLLEMQDAMATESAAEAATRPATAAAIPTTTDAATATGPAVADLASPAVAGNERRRSGATARPSHLAHRALSAAERRAELDRAIDAHQTATARLRVSERGQALLLDAGRIAS